jgi:hypothetical protein
VIDDYLAELLAHLRLPMTRRQRIVSEVEDHLACVAAELHAEGLNPEQAEREAISRFGTAPELARTFHEQEAARGGLQAAHATAACALVCAAVLISARGPFPSALVGFVFGQVALVAGAVTFVRAWCIEGGPYGWRLALVLRGSLVVLACAVIGIGTGVGIGTGGVRGWAALAALSPASVLTSATALRSRRKALAVSGSLDAAGAQDILVDVQRAAMLALERGARRVPTLRRAVRLVEIVPWGDLRRHPWRFGVAVSAAAGVALAVGHGLTEGGLPPVRHLPLALLGGTLLFAIEALAALLGFALLGRYLGLRSGTGAPSPER